MEEGENVLTAGLVVRRQSPLGNAIFITLEDEFGHIPLIVWQSTYHALKEHLSKPLIQIEGIVSKKEGTLNIIVTNSVELKAIKELPHSNNWSYVSWSILIRHQSAFAFSRLCLSVREKPSSVQHYLNFNHVNGNQ